MNGFIYIADDEKYIRDLIEKFLIEAGHEVRVFEDGESLLDAFFQKEPDLVILDVMMPGIDGFMVCSKIRKASTVPILLLTARDTDADYITGFTLGCDDYFTKPFSPVKLTMRVNAIIKRETKDLDVANNKKLTFEDVVLDQGMKSCAINQKLVKLTTTEFELMAYLLTSLFSCTIFSDMVCCLLSEWCVVTSFYQRFANHVSFYLRNLLYSISKYLIRSKLFVTICTYE